MHKPYKPYKFCKNRARDPPLRGNYIGQIPFFSVLGAVNPHPWADQGEIWQGGAVLPNFTLIGVPSRPCGAKNPKIGPWVNEIPAELPFGQILPVFNGRYLNNLLHSLVEMTLCYTSVCSCLDVSVFCVCAHVYLYFSCSFFSFLRSPAWWALCLFWQPATFHELLCYLCILYVYTCGELSSLSLFVRKS